VNDGAWFDSTSNQFLAFLLHLLINRRLSLDPTAYGQSRHADLIAKSIHVDHLDLVFFTSQLRT
jgi:hypothetical protein